jgi:hypothetical protein
VKTSPTRFVALTSALLCGLLAPLTSQAATTTSRLLFEVSYDGRPIGTHRFEVDREGAIKRVRSQADFHVQVLFVSLYRYRHEAVETWRDGCLQHLESTTDDNGRRFAVTVAEQAAALQVTRSPPGPGAVLLADDCAGTFAYWDLTQLERSALINSQTGSMTPVALSFEGEDRLAGEPALRYRLAPAGMDPITLWYRAGDRQWLGLETQRDRAVLRYTLSKAETAPEVASASGFGPDAVGL